MLPGDDGDVGFPPKKNPFQDLVMANHDQIVNCRMFPWQIYRINAQNHQTPRRPGDASIAAPFTTKDWMGCYGQDLRTSGCIGCMVPADRTRKRTFQDHSSLNTKKDKKGVLFPKIDDVTATPSLKPLVVVAASVLRYHKITLCLHLAIFRLFRQAPSVKNCVDLIRQGRCTLLSVHLSVLDTGQTLMVFDGFCEAV